jgi:hypothetical protein
MAAKAAAGANVPASVAYQKQNDGGLELDRT